MAPWRRSGATLCCLLRFGIPAPQHAVAGWRDWGSRPFGARCVKRHLPLVTPRPVFASDAYFFGRLLWWRTTDSASRTSFAAHQAWTGSPRVGTRPQHVARQSDFFILIILVLAGCSDLSQAVFPGACFPVGGCVFGVPFSGQASLVVLPNRLSWRAQKKK